MTIDFGDLPAGTRLAGQTAGPSKLEELSSAEGMGSISPIESQEPDASADAALLQQIQEFVDGSSDTAPDLSGAQSPVLQRIIAGQRGPGPSHQEAPGPLESAPVEKAPTPKVDAPTQDNRYLQAILQQNQILQQQIARLSQPPQDAGHQPDPPLTHAQRDEILRGMGLDPTDVTHQVSFNVMQQNAQLQAELGALREQLSEMNYSSASARVDAWADDQTGRVLDTHFKDINIPSQTRAAISSQFAALYNAGHQPAQAMNMALSGFRPILEQIKNSSQPKASTPPPTTTPAPAATMHPGLAQVQNNPEFAAMPLETQGAILRAMLASAASGNGAGRHGPKRLTIDQIDSMIFG